MEKSGNDRSAAKKRGKGILGRGIKPKNAFDSLAHHFLVVVFRHR
jgi:hypothetical protein